MAAIWRGLTYCRQVAYKLAFQNTAGAPCKQLESNLLNAQCCSVLATSVRNKTYIPPDKFDTPSPFKPRGPARHGFNPRLFDGGPLPRGLAEPFKNKKKFARTNIWNKKRATFGQNDYIDILSDSGLRPVDVIKCPAWIRGFNGNEMQRLIRRMHIEGPMLKQLYPTQYKNMWKRIKFLYKKYNQRRAHGS